VRGRAALPAPGSRPLSRLPPGSDQRTGQQRRVSEGVREPRPSSAGEPGTARAAPFPPFQSLTGFFPAAGVVAVVGGHLRAVRGAAGRHEEDEAAEGGG